MIVSEQEWAWMWIKETTKQSPTTNKNYVNRLTPEGAVETWRRISDYEKLAASNAGFKNAAQLGWMNVLQVMGWVKKRAEEAEPCP